MAAERFSLILDSKTTGTAEVEKLEAALRKVTDAAENVGKKSEAGAKKAQSSFDSIHGTVKGAVTDPMGSASQALEGFASKFGVAGAAAAGFVTVAGAAGFAAFKLAKHVGELAESQSNAAMTLGMSVKDYGLFSQAAEDAGVSADSLVTSFKSLSQALSDNSDEGQRGKRALRDLGIEATDAFGSVKPMRELLLEISDGLGKMTSASERASAAQKILGRPALSLLPVLNGELRNTIAELEKLGVGFDKAGAATALRFDNALDRLTARLKTFAKEAGIAVAAAAGFEDPEKTKADIERRRRERETRFAPRTRYNAITGRYETPELSLTQQELLAPALRSAPQGLNGEQFAAMQRTATRQKINAILSSDGDPQARLVRARKDLDEAITADDVDAVRRSQSRVKALETEIEAASKAKAAAEALKQTREKLDEVIYKEFLTRQIKGRESNTDFSDLVGSNVDWFSREALLGTLGRDRDVLTGRTPQQETNALAVLSDATDAEAKRRDVIRQTVDYQARLIELLAGPGSELAAAKAVAAVRIEALEKMKTLGADLFDIEQERARVLQDLELRRLEIVRERESAVRNAGERGFDALLAGGAGIRSLLLSQAAGMGRSLSGNLSVELFRGAAGKLALPGQTNAAGGLNTFGRILQGTPFGVSPEKVAVDANTQATIQNTAAILSMSGGTTGKGAASILSMGGIDLSRVFGGVDPLTGISTFNGTSGRGTSVYAQNAAMVAGIPVVPMQSTAPGYLKAVGTGATVAAGGFGVYSGLKQGGAQGGLTAASSALGTAAALDPEPISKAILAVAAVAAGAAAAIMGNPKERRAKELDERIEGSRYEGGTGADYFVDIQGRGLDYDRRGSLRPIQITVQQNIAAMDAKSFDDRAQDIARAAGKGIVSGMGGELVEAIRGAVMPQ